MGATRATCQAWSYPTRGQGSSAPPSRSTSQTTVARKADVEPWRHHDRCPGPRVETDTVPVAASREGYVGRPADAAPGSGDFGIFSAGPNRSRTRPSLPTVSTNTPLPLLCFGTLYE